MTLLSLPVQVRELDCLGREEGLVAVPVPFTCYKKGSVLRANVASTMLPDLEFSSWSS
jgi:hypothetical protein